MFGLFKKKNQETEMALYDGKIQWHRDSSKHMNVVCNEDLQCDYSFSSCSSCPVFYYHQGVSQMETEQLALAMQNFIQAVNMDPQFAAGWVKLGTISGIGGKHTAALKFYNNAVRIDMIYERAIYGLVIALRQLGRIEEAKEISNQLYQMNPHYKFQQLAETLDETLGYEIE